MILSFKLLKMESVKVGDVVKFEYSKKQEFLAETKSKDGAMNSYQLLLLASVDALGTISDQKKDISYISLFDGGILPVLTKFLTSVH